MSELTGVEVESSDFEVASSEAPLVISDEDIEKSDETEVKTEAVKPFDEIKKIKLCNYRNSARS